MSAILGQLGRLGTLGGASTGGLSIAAMRSRFVAAGMASLYLPYAASSAYSVYYGDGLLTSVGGVIGLIVDQLPSARLGGERFNIAVSSSVTPSLSINATAGTITKIDTASSAGATFGSAVSEYGWGVGDIIRTVWVASGLDTGIIGYHSSSCFGESYGGNGAYDRFLAVSDNSRRLVVGFAAFASPSSVMSGNSARRLQGYHLRQVNNSPRPSLARSAGGVLYYNFPAGTSISPTVSIGSAGAGAMLVAVPGGAPQWYTGLTITSSFAISATHAPSGAAAIALFPSLPDAATRAWLESIFTKIGLGVRI